MTGRTLRNRELADEYVEENESKVANLPEAQPVDSRNFRRSARGRVKQNHAGIVDGRKVESTVVERDSGKETFSVDKASNSVHNQVPSPDYLNVIMQMLLEDRAERTRDKEETERKNEEIRRQDKE
jgi:hypothetical protein